MKLTLAFLTAFIFYTQPAKAQDGILTFNLNRSDIVSWQEHENSISVEMTPEHQEELFNLTKNNVDKLIKFMIENKEVSTAIIHEPINSKSMLFSGKNPALLEILKTK